jgi:tetratricopeptide (TPR) repeat protein
MSHLSQKSAYLLPVFFLALVGSWFASQVQLSAQTESGCSILNRSRLTEQSILSCQNSQVIKNVDEEKLNLALPMALQGRRYMQAKQYEEAIAIFTQAIDVYPDYAEAYMGRAYSKISLDMQESSVLEDFQNAENAYRRRGQPNEADNIADLIQQWQREKRGM